ncbi:hypothetical protein LJC23_01955 [Desulfovibrio sp. OttesenSCG-928-I05]|nr:hypothetical protein [Desulfovibrio sp. OttesenSCG-928-I05]
MIPFHYKNIRIKRVAGVFLTAALCFGFLPSPATAWEVHLPPSNAPAMPSDLQSVEQVSGGGIIRGAVPVTERDGSVNGLPVGIYEIDGRNMGFAVPDGGGGVTWVPAPSSSPSAGYMEARELRLKVRELTEQLIAGMSIPAKGTVALPTSFVHQDDFTQTSSLGRFVAEQLFHEFTQRGFPVREYRLGSMVRVKEGQGEFLLSRDVADISAKNSGLVFVVGTYYVDRDAVFMNARLIRGTDGGVLRTAQLIIPANAMARRMLAGGGKTLETGTLTVRDFKTATQPTNLTPIDLGEDIH